MAGKIFKVKGYRFHSVEVFRVAGETSIFQGLSKGFDRSEEMMEFHNTEIGLLAEQISLVFSPAAPKTALTGSPQIAAPIMNQGTPALVLKKSIQLPVSFPEAKTRLNRFDASLRRNIVLSAVSLGAVLIGSITGLAFGPRPVALRREQERIS